MDLRVPVLLHSTSKAASNETGTENNPSAPPNFKLLSIPRTDRTNTLDHIHSDHHFNRVLWTSMMPSHDNWEDFWPFYVLLALGMLFGGIHMLPWNFSFPTLTEHLLWRICAVIIISGPVVVFLLANHLLGKCLGYYIMWTVAVAYIPARMVLLILPFLTLRSLEPAVYRSISWFNLLPHIG